MPTAPGFDPVILSAGRLRLTLLPYGLTLHALEVLPHPASACASACASATGPTAVRDLLVGPATPAEHHHSHPSGRKFLNQTVGRYANRLPAGRSVLPSGAVLELGGADGVCLHGGRAGLDTVVWDVRPADQSELFAEADVPAGSALFGYESEAGAGGFPLRLAFEGLVSVVPSGERLSLGTVRVQLRARIVEEGRAEERSGTPVNATVHWGFNLADLVGGAEGETGAQAHKLFVDVSTAPNLSNRCSQDGADAGTRV